MDYKTFLIELDTIRKDFSLFTDEAIQKNVLKAEETVNDYLTEISKGSYSLKSYKAKIIRNELEHHQNDYLIKEKEDKVINKLQELIANYFDTYLELFKTNKFSPTKEKDLKALLVDVKKEKQEANVKKTTLEKEIQKRKEEYEELIKTKDLEYNQKINEIKNKLTSNLLKIRDKTNRTNFEDERRLLDCDEIETIKEIKNKINEARSSGLIEEYNIKVQTYRTLELEETEHLKNKDNIYSEYRRFVLEKEIKINEQQCKLDSLLIQTEEIEKKYDLEQIMLNRQKQFDAEKILYDLLQNHNKTISMEFSVYEQKDKLFLFDIVLMNLYHILTNLQRNNCYDDLITIIYNSINYTKQTKEKINECLRLSTLNHQEQEKKLVDALSSVSTITPIFLENVTSSLTRFYDNYEKQIELIYIGYFHIFMSLIELVIKAHDSIIESSKAFISCISDKYKIKYTKYDYYDLSEYGYMYRYKDQLEYRNKLINYKDYLKVLADNLINLNTEYQVLFNKENHFLDKCLKKNTNRANYLQKENYKEYNKKNKKLTQEIDYLEKRKNAQDKNNLKEIKKGTKKNISSAKSILNSYKKQLT